MEVKIQYSEVSTNELIWHMLLTQGKKYWVPTMCMKYTKHENYSKTNIWSLHLLLQGLCSCGEDKEMPLQVFAKKMGK